MKKLQIEDAEVMRLALQDEIMRSEESRYDHRLHGFLLVSSGLSCGGRWRTFSAIAIERSSIGLGDLNAAVLPGFKKESVQVVQVLWKNRRNGW